MRFRSIMHGNDIVRWECVHINIILLAAVAGDETGACRVEASLIRTRDHLVICTTLFNPNLGETKNNPSFKEG